MGEQVFPEPISSALIFNLKNELFLMKSHKWKDKYVIPGGHVELGETLEDTLKREIKEETNLDVYGLKYLCFHQFIFGDSFTKKKHFIFFNFTCKTDSVNVILNDEAEEHIWIDVEEVLNLPLETYTRKSIELYIKNKKIN